MSEKNKCEICGATFPPLHCYKILYLTSAFSIKVQLTCCQSFLFVFLFSLLFFSLTTSIRFSTNLSFSAEQGQPNNDKYSAAPSFTAGREHCQKHRSNWGQGRRPVVRWTHHWPKTTTKIYFKRITAMRCRRKHLVDNTRTDSVHQNIKESLSFWIFFVWCSMSYSP